MILMDHKPLLGRFTPIHQTLQVLSPRVQRWSVFLAGYQYSLQYHQGKAMSHTDALSCLPLLDVNPDPSPTLHILLLEELQDQPFHTRDITCCTGRDCIFSHLLPCSGLGGEEIAH